MIDALHELTRISEGVATRYKCPNCGGSNTYGGDPYPCSQCRYDGRPTYSELYREKRAEGLSGSALLVAMYEDPRYDQPERPRYVAPHTVAERITRGV